MAKSTARTAVHGNRDAPPPGPSPQAATPWWGAVVRAAHGPATLRGITLNLDFDWSDVVVLSSVDIPHLNALPAPGGALPLLVEHLVRHAGEAIALVAAPSRAKALDAARNVRPDLEPIPIERREAVQVLHRSQLTRGDARGVRVGERVEGRYTIDPALHVARAEPLGRVTVPARGPVLANAAREEAGLVREALRAALGTDEVNLIDERSGLTADPIRAGLEAAFAALLSMRCSAPVQMAVDPEAPPTVAGWPVQVDIVTQVESSGRLLSFVANIRLDAGAWAGLAPQALQHAVEHALGPYRCPHVRVEGEVLSSVRAPPSASPESVVASVLFALERHMDRIARALSMDPLELRRINAMRKGDLLTSTRERLDRDLAGAALLQAQASWEASQPPPLRDAPGAGGIAARRLAGHGLALGLLSPDWPGTGPSQAGGPVFACAAVDLAVDLDTGEIILRRVLVSVSTLGEAGPPGHNLSGAVVRGLRWALGAPLSGPGVLTPAAPEPMSTADCPEVTVLRPGDQRRTQPTLAEPAVVGAVAAAVAQALETATGASLERLPMPSDMALEASP